MRSKAPGLRKLAKAHLGRQSPYGQVEPIWTGRAHLDRYSPYGQVELVHRGPTTYRKVDVCIDSVFCTCTKQTFK